MLSCWFPASFQWKLQEPIPNPRGSSRCVSKRRCLPDRTDQVRECALRLSLRLSTSNRCYHPVCRETAKISLLRLLSRASFKWLCIRLKAGCCTMYTTGSREHIFIIPYLRCSEITLSQINVYMIISLGIMRLYIFCDATLMLQHLV